MSMSSPLQPNDAESFKTQVGKTAAINAAAAGGMMAGMAGAIALIAGVAHLIEKKNKNTTPETIEVPED